MTNHSMTFVRSLRRRFQTLGIAFAATLISTSCASATSTITSPTPGSVLPGTTVTFKWRMGSEIVDYKLSVGTASGNWNIYSADEKANSSAIVSGIPADGKTVYVNLAAENSRGTWTSRTYAYTDPPAASSVSVSITPQTASLTAAASQSITASVSGSTNTGVTWSTSGGTIAGTGNTVSTRLPRRPGNTR